VRTKITIELEDTGYELLRVLTCGPGAPPTVEGVIGELIDHAQQGVYRPGAWERSWLCQAFGADWIAALEPGDPYGRTNCEHLFERPRRRRPRRKS
jgi:hypothetical protein